MILQVNHRRGGQASIEVIVAIGFLMLIFIVVALLAYDKSRDSTEIKMFLDAKKIATSVADNVNTISEEGSGYYRHFSIPENVFGGHEYNITFYENFVEISWNNRTWSTQTFTSNVTAYCLDYGLNETNRILNENNMLVVTCHRPNLKTVGGSQRIQRSGANVTLSVDVTNFAQVHAPSFTVRLNDTYVDVGSLGAYETTMVGATFTNMSSGENTIYVHVDAYDDVFESIESDNEANITFVV